MMEKKKSDRESSSIFKDAAGDIQREPIDARERSEAVDQRLRGALISYPVKNFN